MTAARAPCSTPRAPVVSGRGVAAAVQPVAGGLDAHQRHVAVAHERGERADGVGAAAHAGDQPVGQAPLGGLDLLADLLADRALEVAHHRRVGRRAHGRPDHVVGVPHVGHPVADGGADRLLEGARADVHGLDRGAQQVHALHVGLLAAHVLGAHVHHALQVQQRAGGGDADAVLAGAGLGDHAALAHPLGQQRLAERVVDLVRAGVQQVLALEVDGPAQLRGQPPGAVQRRGPARVVAQQLGQLGGVGRVLAGLQPRGLELVQRRDQGLGHEAAAVGAELALAPGCLGRAHAVLGSGSVVRTARKNAVSLAGSL